MQRHFFQSTPTLLRSEAKSLCPTLSCTSCKHVCIAENFIADHKAWYLSVLTPKQKIQNTVEEMEDIIPRKRLRIRAINHDRMAAGITRAMTIVVKRRIGFALGCESMATSAAMSRTLGVMRTHFFDGTHGVLLTDSKTEVASGIGLNEASTEVATFCFNAITVSMAKSVQMSGSGDVMWEFLGNCVSAILPRDASGLRRCG